MKKAFLTIIGVLVISLVVWGGVNAFTMGMVDGQWSCIEPDGLACGSAEADEWATGPVDGSTDYDNPTDTWGYYTQQSDYTDNNPSYTDWNQVRYGDSGFLNPFRDKSGFGFDGVGDIYEGSDGALTEGEAFLLGKWCHFNNPISASDLLEYVDLEVRIEGLTCPGGGTIDNDLLEVRYRFTLDETDNNANPCPYLPGDPINDNGCADGVFVGATPLASTFTCTYDGSSTEYKVVILGLVPLADSLNPCPLTPEGDLAFEFYSAEEQDNCGCLYARILEVTGTAVELNAFSATSAEAGVEISWETASEVDNLGFNLYRASSPIAMKQKLNESMIPSKAIGSTAGSVYTYLDEGLLATGKFFYWLESIDLSGSTDLYGPVEIFIFK